MRRDVWVSKARVKSPLLIAVMVLGFLCSSFLFMAYWETNSTNQNLQTIPTNEYANGTLVTSNKMTLTIENYVPWLAKTILFDVYRDTYLPNSSTPKTERVYNLTAENITIQQMTWTVTYGESTLGSPVTFSNPPTLTGFSIPRMSKSTITIDWKYNTTQPHFNSSQITYGLGFSLTPRSGFSLSSLLQPILRVVPYDFQPLLLSFIFFLPCTLTGFISAMYALRNKPVVKNAYHYLRDFDSNDPESDDNIKKLKKNINALKYGPNLLGSVPRLFLGLSLLIFKLRVSALCKYQDAKCTIETNDKFEKEFSTNIEAKESKVSDLIPENKTILALIGILTSVGVSLSFNLGAIAPVLLSIGAFYVFLNIGSTFYLFGGKSKDLALPTLLFFVAIAAMSFQTILLLLRA